MFEVDEDGRTCLHCAVFGGSLPVMRYLMDQRGLDLSLRAAVSCGVVHDIVGFVHLIMMLSILCTVWLSKNQRHCYTCSSMHTTHMSIHPHMSCMYHTHKHVSHELATLQQ